MNSNNNIFDKIPTADKTNTADSTICGIIINALGAGSENISSKRNSNRKIKNKNNKYRKTSKS